MHSYEKKLFIGYTYMGNGILSPQVNFVAKLYLPMCLNLKQQGCLRWLACWATWATNKESSNLSFILGYVHLYLHRIWSQMFLSFFHFKNGFAWHF